MRVIVNELAAHGGFIPHGCTFLIFSDLCARRSGWRP
jgi:transketolase